MDPTKAFVAGTRRRELLPPEALGPEQVPAQFEVTVAPLPRGRAHRPVCSGSASRSRPPKAPGTGRAGSSASSGAR